MNTPEQPRWLDQVRIQLDNDARDLDATTASRLNRARQSALDAALARPQSRLRFLPYALAASMAALLALTVMLRLPEPAAPLPAAAAPSSADDFDLLAGTEELEMIEDLEFYAWLEQQSLDG
jgi:hypothetical protein